MVFKFLNKYIFKLSSLTLQSNGVYINDTVVSFPPVPLPLSFSKGLFIHSLTIGERTYRFFNTADINFNQSSLDALRESYWKEYYKKLFENLISISEKFDKIMCNYSRYMRVGFREKLFDRLHSNGIPSALDHENEMRLLGFPVSNISQLMKEFCRNRKEAVEKINERFITRESLECKELFDDMEEHKLTDMQCTACVTDEQNVLVIAGAGTGKTSTMRAKAAYLVRQGYAAPEEILMLAYGSDAKEELEDRVYEKDELRKVKIETFHSLGKKIIGIFNNSATDVDVLATDDKKYVKFIDEHVELLVKVDSLKKVLSEYFGQYFYPKPSELEFKSTQEYQAYVATNELRDLNGNRVKSYEEVTISNYLYQTGIKFQYEPRYEFNVSAPGKNVYKPDFYLPDFDVYIEHFGIDKEGNTRKGIDKESYNIERQWKIDTHLDKGTVLLETFSYESNQGLSKVLDGKLKKHCKVKELDFKLLCNPPSHKEFFSVLKELGLFKDFSRLLGSFISLFRNSHYTLETLPTTNESGYNLSRKKLFHRLFSHVYNSYIIDLNKKGTIDFSDMIRNSIDIINNNDFHNRTNSKFKFKYIMVDEFQDISQSRADFVLALKNKGVNCGLFCVGDDWQAIYRFTGSDVGLTTGFSNVFGEVKELYLDKTFRFNDRLEKVASGFVQENMAQLSKNLKTHATGVRTEVHVLTGVSDNVLRDALTRIQADTRGASASVLVLARFNKSLKNVKTISAEFSCLSILYMSAHSAKGKEADYVVVLDVVKGKYGFPSEIETDSLLESLLPKLETFLHAEERRLFYVALSRAKKTVFIHTKLGYESTFLKELKAKNYEVNFNKADLADVFIEDAVCSGCEQGSLIPRDGRNGLFYACSMNDKYCNETFSPCDLCKAAPFIRNENIHFCGSSDCDNEKDACPSCEVGYLHERVNGKNKTRFMACSRFNSVKEGCDFTMSLH
jgi:DNA helicase-4